MSWFMFDLLPRWTDSSRSDGRLRYGAQGCERDRSGGRDLVDRQPQPPELGGTSEGVEVPSDLDVVGRPFDRVERQSRLVGRADRIEEDVVDARDLGEDFTVRFVH